MTPSCPPPDAIARLLDGEASENQAAALRDHLAECPHCTRERARQRRMLADLAAPPAGLRTDAVFAAVVAGLAAPTPRRARVPMVAWLAVAAAAAALLVLVVLVPGREEDVQTFVARGGSSGGLAQRIGVTLHRVDARATVLAPGELVGDDTRYLASYRNVDAKAPAYLLVFAVDSAHSIHWLYPPYLDASSDPASVPLAPAASETALPEVVVLDHPAPGPLRLISVVSSVPRRVSEIEQLSAADLQPDALRSRFHDDVVRELTAIVAPRKVTP